MPALCPNRARRVHVLRFHTASPPDDRTWAALSRAAYVLSDAVVLVSESAPDSPRLAAQVLRLGSEATSRDRPSLVVICPPPAEPAAHVPPEEALLASIARYEGEAGAERVSLTSAFRVIRCLHHQPGSPDYRATLEVRLAASRPAPAPADPPLPPSRARSPTHWTRPLKAPRRRPASASGWPSCPASSSGSASPAATSTWPTFTTRSVTALL